MSATIEVVDAQESMLGSGRFATDQSGYAALRRYAKTWPERVWAVEGANGVGRPLAQRLLEAGEQVVDAPSKLAARVRLFDTGHNRKTDAHDAHSIAIVAVRTEGLRVLRVDGELEALRMLADRREALTRRRVQTVDRLQALLAELLPGQTKKDITTGQAKAMLATVRPRDIAGKTRSRIDAEELSELIAVEAKIKKAIAELKHVAQEIICDGDPAMVRMAAEIAGPASISAVGQGWLAIAPTPVAGNGPTPVAGGAEELALAISTVVRRGDHALVLWREAGRSGVQIRGADLEPR